MMRASMPLPRSNACRLMFCWPATVEMVTVSKVSSIVVSDTAEFSVA